MKPEDIPDFINTVMEQIEIGIDKVAKRTTIAIEPPAGVDPPPIHVSFPREVELMLNVDAKVDDGTPEGDYESQSLWVKIPWPTRVV
jgi:hypothetical protein